MLDARSLEGALAMRDAIDLLEEMSRHEAAGGTFISPRLNSAFDGGWMRMMFGVNREAGYFATKSYHLIEGAGVRYVVSLYRLADGELLAVMDGRLITDLRTGAASGVAARKVPVSGPVRIGVLGAGHQARMQLESLAAVYPVRSATVFSPTAAHREGFAREMAAKLKFPVVAAESAEAAARGHDVVVAATSSRSREPVLRGAWLDRCRLLCAVGSTRPEAIEVDLTGLEINYSKHLSDIELPANVRVVGRGDPTLVTIVPPSGYAEELKAAQEAAAAAAAAAAAPGAAAPGAAAPGAAPGAAAAPAASGGGAAEKEKK